MEEKGTIVIVGVLGLFVLVGAVFLFLSASNASALGDGRTPVPPPVTAPPPCPSDFDDSMGFEYGIGDDNFFVMTALQNAEDKCYDLYDQDYQSQNAELASNRQSCESVEGCKLTYHLQYDSCEGDAVADCEPSYGTTGPFHCEVTGHYDISDYKCRRPATPKPPKTTQGT